MEMDPTDLERRDRYKLLIGSVVPRPIAFITTVSPAGKPNLAPYSFFTPIGSNPMTLLFCPANGSDGSEKDTLRNAKPSSEGGTGEFVVNVAIEPYARAVAAAGEPLPYEESELGLVGLSQAASRVVFPPRVAESPVSYECRTRDVIRLASHEPGGANIVVGEVVWVHVDNRLLDERKRIDPARLKAIGRMGGTAYCRTRDLFDLPFGEAALTASVPFPSE
jgi:flavin reductase (DIM6/NTAB) family NADH-FMN oxidoreductase RutF